MNIFDIRIEWHSIMRDLIKNAWAIFMAVLIGIMGIYIATRSIYTPEYTSSATLVVNAKSSATGSYSLFSVSVEMTDIISRVLVEPSVKDKANQILGSENFDGVLSADVYDGTNFVNLKVTSDSPQKSYDLLKAVLEAYPQVSDSVFDNVVISVLSMPEVPHSPSNSISTVNKIVVSTACAILVAGCVVILSILRDTVKDEKDFKNKIDAKLLGTIPHEKKHFSIKERLEKKNKALLIHNNAFISLKFVENYHKIAAKLEHINRHKGSKVFAITSATANEGKSTTASNIAISLADRGHTVVLIDIDCKKPALYKIFEKKYNENSEFGCLMNGTVKSDEFHLIRYKQTSLYLAVNTSPYSEYGEWIENRKLSQVIEVFKNQVDFVILDTAPLSADDYVTDLAKLVDETVIVVRTDFVHSSIVNDTITIINEVGGTVAGCILNDVYPEFSFLTMTGTDESGYYYRKGYGKYGKSGRYEQYSKYSKYANTYLDTYLDKEDSDNL